MNDIEKVQEQVRKALQQQLGKPNLTGDDFSGVIRSALSGLSEKQQLDKYEVKLQHSNKSWVGRLADWFEWKTPLRRWSCSEWRRLDYLTEYDVKAFYNNYFSGGNNYKVRRNRIYIKFPVSNPYHTFDVSWTMKVQPIEYTKIDLEVK